MEGDSSQLISELDSLTKTVRQALENDDYDAALEELKRREKVLSRMQERSNLSDLASKKSKIESIMQVDKQNMVLLNRKIKETMDAISVLAKEKQSIENLRSISRMSQRKIVDVRH